MWKEKPAQPRKAKHSTKRKARRIIARTIADGSLDDVRRMFDKLDKP